LTEKRIQKAEEVVGLSLKVIVITGIVIILFGIYLGVLIYGENSLTELEHLKQEKQNLLEEAQLLKNENQRLQKEFFELKQLEPGEE
jgi:hypothetical protein